MGRGRGILFHMMEDSLLELAIQYCECGNLVNTVQLFSDTGVFMFKDFYYVLYNG